MTKKQKTRVTYNKTHDREKKRILPNAFFSVLQVIVTSVMLFFLYRFLLFSVGVESMGVWSLVAAAASLANVSKLGLSGCTVKFVSKYLALNDGVRAAQVVETVVLSIAVFMGVIVLFLWPIGEWLLVLVVPYDRLELAHALLPYTLAGLWLNSIGDTFYSSLDGCHRADRRSIANIVMQPFLLVLAMIFVPHFGLIGLAYAQIIQYLIWLTLGWVLLKKHLPLLSLVPRYWSLKLFLEMWRYGLNFQLISILNMLSEPFAKGLLSHFGNLSAVGYFEMANRLVVQVRALLISANQILVPYYSKLNVASPHELKEFYKNNLNTVILIGSLIFSCFIALLPSITYFWIGNFESQFLLFSILLSLGWFSNVLIGPAYFANLGIGRLSHNLWGHIVQTVSTIIFAVVGGISIGAEGSAMAFPLALMMGAMTTLVAFHKAENIPISILVSISNIKAMASGSVIALSNFVIYFWLFSQIGASRAMLVTIILVLIECYLFVALIPEARLLVKRLCGYNVLIPFFQKKCTC